MTQNIQQILKDFGEWFRSNSEGLTNEEYRDLCEEISDDMNARLSDLEEEADE